MFFSRVKEPGFLFLSTFFIKIILNFILQAKILLNVGFGKILFGMTLAEKQAFLDQFKDTIQLTVESLPANIREILDTNLFVKEATLYVHSLNTPAPSEEILAPDNIGVFNAIGTFLWDNKVTIFIGILNLFVLAVLNHKINIVNDKLSNEIKTRMDSVDTLAKSDEVLRKEIYDTAHATSDMIKSTEATSQKVDLIFNKIIAAKLNDNHIFDVEAPENSIRIFQEV